jgi:quinol monooxygenase YgiN
MFGLCVRFTCKDETSAKAYDRLVAETIEAIKVHEPGTLVYASHLVDGQPLQRIFYELYRDEDAFHAHRPAKAPGEHPVLPAGPGSEDRSRATPPGLVPA